MNHWQEESGKALELSAVRCRFASDLVFHRRIATAAKVSSEKMTRIFIYVNVKGWPSKIKTSA